MCKTFSEQKYVRMNKRCKEPEPKSWAELLKQKEATRNMPPDKSYYTREKIRTYTDGGIFAKETDDNPEYTLNAIPTDTHSYSTTAIFDPPEVVVRKPKPSRDHGLKLIAWDGKTIPGEEKLRVVRKIKPPHENEDFNSITGVSKRAPFKSTIQQIIKHREQSQQVMQTRTFDPISNTFPSQSLENTRTQQEELERMRQHEFVLSKLPPNEKRAHETLVNIVTGEAKDLEVAEKYVCSFNSPIERIQNSMKKEKEIVEGREREFQRKQAQVGCRYNTPGRARELKDWDLINGSSKVVGMDESVKAKPSVWQWCQTESIQ